MGGFGAQAALTLPNCRPCRGGYAVRYRGNYGSCADSSVTDPAHEAERPGPSGTCLRLRLMYGPPDCKGKSLRPQVASVKALGGIEMQEIVIRSKQDVARFVNEQPTSKNAQWIVLIALGGVFVDAYDFTSLGIGVVQLRSQFNLSPFAVGSVTAMVAFGAFFGALWGGYYTDKIGRYKMFLLDLIFLVVAAIGAAVSINIWMLLFFRFLMGIGVGLDFPVALSFIAEFVNARKKGGNVNLWQGMWYLAASCTGLVILPFYYYADLGNHLWRIAVGFGAFPALIILLLRYRFMDESPTWAAHNLGLHETARVLEKTYQVRVRVEPEQAASGPGKINFFEIFSPQYRARTILASIICATQSMEYFAVGFNLPSISTRLFRGEFLYAILGAVFF